MRTKEQVYDEEINPLMARIIAICKANEMAFVASCHCPNDDDPNLLCSTVLLNGRYGSHPQLQNAYLALVTETHPVFAAFTITSKDKD